MTRGDRGGCDMHVRNLLDDSATNFGADVVGEVIDVGQWHGDLVKCDDVTEGLELTAQSCYPEHILTIDHTQLEIPRAGV